MAGDVSERRRREVPSELDDIPRRERETIEDGEPQEGVSETGEVTTPSEYVDRRMDKTLHEIETREGKDDWVSQGMDSALHKLEEMSQRSESTEKRLEKALESIEERPVPVEKASASESSDEHYQAKLDDYTDLKDSSETPDTSPEAKMEHHEVYHIEREQLNETVRELDEVESVDVEHISIKIEELVRKSPDSESRIRVGDLSETDIKDEQLDRIKQLLHEEGQAIRDNLRERFVNEENDDIRVGIVQEKLYIWTPDTNPNDMIYGWRSQYFYVDKEDVSRITEETGRKLELGNDLNQSLTHLNELMKQFVDERTYNQISIKDSSSRLTGEALRLYQDATGDAMKDLEGRVHRVAGANGHGGIENPKFPEGQELEPLRARLMATVFSDCHIRLQDSVVEYHEGNLRRIEKVIDQTLKEFGDFNNTPKYIEKDGIYKLKIPNPYGRALNEWGVPSGDKTILNPKLPTEANKWSIDSVIAYHEDMVAEEGHVSPGQISWNRSNTLDNGDKSEKYVSKNLLSQSEIKLIQDKGTVYTKNLNGESVLLWTGIMNLQKSSKSDEADTAKILHDIVQNNGNSLMEGEKALAEKLGIELSIRPVHVVLYPDTERVSVKWETRTSNSEAAIRWGLVCPPNHPEKREELKKWIIKQDPEDVRKIIQEIKEDKIPIHQMWRDYFL